MPTSAAQLLPFAHRLADAAGAVIRSYFGQKLTVDAKADNSPVSIADREAEAAIRALIAAEHPSHAIYGEEYGQSASSASAASPGEPPRSNVDMGAVPPSRYCWVIDPIDGTRAFLAGRKEWGTLIALCDHGVPVLGILDQPVTGERWVGFAGQPTTYNNAAVSTRNCDGLAQATISTTSRDYFTPQQATAFVRLAERCATASAEGDCYAYGLLARGQHDFVVDCGLKPYDILALVPIIEGAGGVITNWDFTPVTLLQYANVLAGPNAALHKEALAILGDWR